MHDEKMSNDIGGNQMSILTNVNNGSERGYLKEEHHIFRKSVRKFLEKEALPNF